jgi:uncharacterized membrane protein YedE/YeeE
MTLLIITLGILFGLSLQISKVNTFNTISGMAILKDFTVAKTIATAIGVGAILLSIEVYFGFADFHIKPFIVGNIVIGGFVFGIGMATLGYCPGTMPISMGQGSLDALVGMIGGLLASVVYTLLAPFLQGAMGPNLGMLALSSFISTGSAYFYITTILNGSLLLVISFWLNRIEKKQDIRWLFSGTGVAVVACIIFYASDRVLGASSFYPFAADNILGVTNNKYYAEQVHMQGFYEMKFLFGAFLSGLLYSLYRKEFRFRLIHENWSALKGNSRSKRIFWSLAGGFLLLFGARLANGCTSGHVISGGMQLAISSWTFAVFVFAGFLLTGALFYRK